MPWKNWKTYTIFRKNNEGKFVTHVASFGSRKLCEDYLKYRKEKCFFETGSMEEAEEKWGMQNFLIDYSLVLDRQTICQNFDNIDFSYWT